MDTKNLSFWAKWQEYIVLAPPTYAIVAYCIGVFQLYYFSTFKQIVVSPALITTFVGIYSLIRFFHALKWHHPGRVAYLFLGADLLICIPLVFVTGGIHSPFLLFTLTPILSAATITSLKNTLFISLFSLVYVIASQVFNPFYDLRLGVADISFFCIYIAAVSLSSMLPFLINVPVRKQMRSEDVVEERQRISREIHDGLAQTLASLRWHVQVLQKELEGKGIESAEIKKMTELIEKVYLETRGYLQVLRTTSGDTGFIANLEEYVSHLNRESGLKINLVISEAQIPMSEMDQVELLRICQEALTNTVKHAAAKNVQIEVILHDDHLKIRLSDDGDGFDPLEYYNQPVKSAGHGLLIMRERAASIDGSCSINSKPGWGTEVQIDVPLKLRKEL
jgi:signal transduction histidine kinase